MDTFPHIYAVITCNFFRNCRDRLSSGDSEASDCDSEISDCDCDCDCEASDCHCHCETSDYDCKVSDCDCEASECDSEASDSEASDCEASDCEASDCHCKQVAKNKDYWGAADQEQGSKGPWKAIRRLGNWQPIRGAAGEDGPPWIGCNQLHWKGPGHLHGIRGVGESMTQR